jgi:predicted flap endonuclease-1-like 5' DNA nuclease
MPAEATLETPSSVSATDEPANVAPTPPSQGSQEGWNPHEQEEETGDAPPPGAGDNLIVIKGIGTVYSARLAEMGITTYGALIATPIDTLATAFPRVPESEIEDWIAQARQLAEQEG